MELKVFVGYRNYLVKVEKNKIRCIPTNKIGTCWENISYTTLFVHNPNYEDIAKLYTNNETDNLARAIFPLLKGAKLIESVKEHWFDYDPYGNPVQRGFINCQKWDLTAIFQ